MVVGGRSGIRNLNQFFYCQQSNVSNIQSQNVLRIICSMYYVLGIYPVLCQPSFCKYPDTSSQYNMCPNSIVLDLNLTFGENLTKFSTKYI